MINYNYIAQAIEFYKASGFEEIDLPWMVHREAVSLTKPKHLDFISAISHRGSMIEDPFIANNTLVGSAEQAFIELILVNGKSFKGTYVATTPCFRDEGWNQYSQPYFLKTELFDNTGTLDYLKMASLASILFNSLGLITDIVTTNEGIDLIETETKVELGSYGQRTVAGVLYSYGTGLAEPRFSTVLNEVRLSKSKL